MRTPTPLDSELAYSNTSSMLITHDRSNAAVKTGTWWTGEGEWEADARRPRTAQHLAGWSIVTGDCRLGYSGWQICGRLLQRKPRQTQHVCRRTFGSRSSPRKFVSRPGKFISQELTSLDLTIPHSQLAHYGSRSFTVCGPAAWNSLPATIQVLSSSSLCFCSHLKTELFCRVYGIKSA